MILIADRYLMDNASALSSASARPPGAPAAALASTSGSSRTHETTFTAGVPLFATPPLREPGQDEASATMPADPASLPPGLERIGGVRLLRLVGTGGMGRVYLGHHEALDLAVAVKVMKDGAGDQERFINEARLAARIHDDHIVRILNAGEEGGRAFLVLEYVAGVNLKQLLAEQGGLPWRKAVDITLQAARGLAAAHRAGVIHRDVKPSNILVAANGVAKVTDLGLAREAFMDSGATETGHVLGTPAYMAPEQARDSRQAGPPADVYALGVSLWHMLAGEVPFKKSSHTNVLFAHLHENVPDIRLRVPELPAVLCELMRRMLAKDPSRRPADGAAVVEELQRILGQPGTASVQRGSSILRRPRISRALGARIAAVLLLGVVVSSGFWAGHGNVAPAVAVGDPAPAANPPVPAGGDAWHTPTRAVCLVGDQLAPATETAILQALAASGLPVVERERVATITGEQHLVRDGHVDQLSAERIGRMVGAHIVVFASERDGKVSLRTDLLETATIVDIQLATPDTVAAKLDGALRKAVAALPVQGLSAGTAVDVGARHGLRVGDHVELLDGTPAAPGRTIATAEVVTVESSHAVIRASQELPAGAPLLVRRPDQAP